MKKSNIIFIIERFLKLKMRKFLLTLGLSASSMAMELNKPEPDDLSSYSLFFPTSNDESDKEPNAEENGKPPSSFDPPSTLTPDEKMNAEEGRKLPSKVTSLETEFVSQLFKDKPLLFFDQESNKDLYNNALNGDINALTLLGCLLYMGGDKDLKYNFKRLFKSAHAFYQKEKKKIEALRNFPWLTAVNENYYQEGLSDNELALNILKFTSEKGCPISKHIIAFNEDRTSSKDKLNFNALKLYRDNIDFIPSLYNLHVREDNFIEEIEKLAENGFAPAQADLGLAYWQGEKINKNLSLAIHWAQKGAQQGDPDSQLYLAYMCQELANMNSEQELKCLCQKLECAKHTKEDDNKNFCLSLAVYWYQQAANQECAQAQLALGLLYKNGEGVPENLPLAFHWIQQGAQQGHPNSQHYLGYFLQNGIGCEVNLPESAQWYEKGAKQGFLLSQYMLGHYYENGIEVQKNLELAVYWYQQSDEQGYLRSSYSLACLYLKEPPSNNKQILALKYLIKAARRGHKEAAKDLDWMLQEDYGKKVMTPPPPKGQTPAEIVKIVGLRNKRNELAKKHAALQRPFEEFLD